MTELEIARELKAHGLITKPSNPKLLTRVLKRIVSALDTGELNVAIQDAYMLTSGA